MKNPDTPGINPDTPGINPDTPEYSDIPDRNPDISGFCRIFGASSCLGSGVYIQFSLILRI